MTLKKKIDLLFTFVYVVCGIFIGLSVKEGLIQLNCDKSGRIDFHDSSYICKKVEE